MLYVADPKKSGVSQFRATVSSLQKKETRSPSLLLVFLCRKEFKMTREVKSFCEFSFLKKKCNSPEKKEGRGKQKRKLMSHRRVQAPLRLLLGEMVPPELGYESPTGMYHKTKERHCAAQADAGDSGRQLLGHC